MRCSLAELLERFSSQELTRWMAYEQVEPFGERALDDRFAMLIWAACQPHCKTTLKIEDFKLHFHETPRKTPEEMAEILRGMAE